MMSTLKWPAQHVSVYQAEATEDDCEHAAGSSQLAPCWHIPTHLLKPEVLNNLIGFIVSTRSPKSSSKGMRVSVVVRYWPTCSTVGCIPRQRVAKKCMSARHLKEM